MMLDYETRYVMIEHYYLALVWATHRLRYYMTKYSMYLISYLDPLRYLFDRPALVGRLMRLLVLLIDFDIHYVTQKSIRGSIVADHLASLPVSDGRVIDDDFPNKDVVVVTSLSGWRMYFDGVANHYGYEIGVLLISSYGDHIPKYVRLAFSNRHPAINNIVEYEACILGLEMNLELRIRQMEVFGDSNLVLRQIQGKWKTRYVKHRPYQAYLELLTSFPTSIGATPYSLVYGMEAMLPVEIKMGSLRVALKQHIPKADWAQARLDKLNLLNEKKLRTANHVRAYQRKMGTSGGKEGQGEFLLELGDKVFSSYGLKEKPTERAEVEKQSFLGWFLERKGSSRTIKSGSKRHSRYVHCDNVKFGLPITFTITMMSWIIVEYGKQMSANGELGHAMEAVKWVIDYLIKAHPYSYVFCEEVLQDVRSSFLERKTMMDVSINDSEYHSDYLRMLQIDILTGKGRVVACVDVNGRCFFMKLFNSEEVANGLENLNMKSKIRFGEHFGKMKIERLESQEEIEENSSIN
uniref:cellulase n=1 Tax=Vitis vinifera TaxID=29760 RepID=A5AX16_VITVI|nr:hypothetical protein VITISV_043219 [Vitis vinifera]